jgi:hypothetical protein
MNRSRSRAYVSIAIAVGFTALAIGCNSILDNESATLGPIVGADAGDAGDRSTTGTSQDGGVATMDATSREDAADAFVSMSDATADVVVSEDAGGSPGCGAGTKSCDGVCSATDDPLVGCGNASCAPCAVTRAQAACSNGTCIIATCNAGYADCDLDPSNGCETDLSQATHCGSCNAICPAASPLCAPSGTTFACTTGCTAASPDLCGTQCVDTKTSTNHCGDCNTPCPAVANGAASCSGGACEFACNANFHACGSTCASNSSVNSCGSSCTPCTAPNNGVATCTSGVCGSTCDTGFHSCGGVCVSNSAVATCGTSCAACAVEANATATCNGTTCGATCASGYGDCDGNTSNGCEATLATDANNCGKCKTVCALGVCIGGSCVGGAIDAGAADAGIDAGADSSVTGEEDASGE